MDEAEREQLKQAADFDIEQLPRETLLTTARAYCRLYQILDGLWYLSAKEKWGNDVAVERDLWVWGKVPKYEIQAIARVLGLQDKKDLRSFLRVFMLTPINASLEWRLERLTDTECIVTFTSCPILRALEKEGEGREKSICQEIDPVILQNYATAFNPDIVVKPLKLPPRLSPNDIACQWEITLRPHRAKA